MAKAKYLNNAGLTLYDNKIKQWVRNNVGDLTEQSSVQNGCIFSQCLSIDFATQSLNIYGDSGAQIAQTPFEIPFPLGRYISENTDKFMDDLQNGTIPAIVVPIENYPKFYNIVFRLKSLHETDNGEYILYYRQENGFSAHTIDENDPLYTETLILGITIYPNGADMEVGISFANDSDSIEDGGTDPEEPAFPDDPDIPAVDEALSNGKNNPITS